MKPLAIVGAAVAALLAVSCSKPTPAPEASQTITFSVLSAEDQQSMSKVWQPLFDDMHKATGLTIKPFYASNYTSLVEAMRFKQTQAGWFSALPALEAVNRADAEVLGRVIDAGGDATYTSVLIVKKGSGITLDKVLACGQRYSFGLGDAKSTSGTLAPMAYLFTPKGIEPSKCFKVVRSASHQVNAFRVGNARDKFDAGRDNEHPLRKAPARSHDMHEFMGVDCTLMLDEYRGPRRRMRTRLRLERKGAVRLPPC